jgi:hypothetical protein
MLICVERGKENGRVSLSGGVNEDKGTCTCAGGEEGQSAEEGKVKYQQAMRGAHKLIRQRKVKTYTARRLGASCGRERRRGRRPPMEGRWKGWDGVECGGIGELLVKEGFGERKQEHGLGCGVRAHAL